jgi:hypothetical protein
LPVKKSIISVGFYVAMIIIIFNKCPEPVNVNLLQEIGLLPSVNIYQQYIVNIVFASGLSIVFNALCARIELGAEWGNSDYVCNRWTFIYAGLLYSGAILGFLMFFVANSIILWRIYQIVSFFLVAFLDLDRVEALCNYFFTGRK